ncbi:MAG: MBL fold metallo-hydrolase [Pirellulaceae bacterium]|nr:MBL fold metallo-hydrolase [Pirellulaceae bacterium]
MRLTIHRGTKEIGGSCVEIATQSTKIIIDVGLPLVDQNREPFDRSTMRGKSLQELVKDKVIPDVSGLFTSGAEAPDAIFLSHAHLDHVGLLKFTPEHVPVYATTGTSKMMLAGAVFAGQDSLPRERLQVVEYGVPITIGDITITPFAVDHSCYGSVAFLVEAEGKRLLYSGDLRWHGRKPGMINALVKTVGPLQIDALVMEGTHFRSKRPPRRTEYDLEAEITTEIRKSPGLVLASFSPIDVDRLVTYLKASMKSGRTFVADVYTAFIMYLLNKEIKLPDPKSSDCVKVYFNKSFERRKIKKLQDMFGGNRIKLSEITSAPDKYVLCFRPSNLRLDFDGTLPTMSHVMYSYWQGYLDKPDWQTVQSAVEQACGTFSQRHTSGHIYVEDIVKFVSAIGAKTVVPIHTFEAERFATQINNITLLTDSQFREI